MSDTWICPDEGKIKILDTVFRVSGTPEAMTLAQFLSGATVSDTSTFADFTIPTYTGYASIAIARGDWDAAIVTAHVGSISKTTNPVFTCTGGSPQTVAGLILYGTTSGKVYLGVNYSTPIVMSSGTTDTVTPLKVQDKTFV
jgi:hypothetical protein